MDDPKGTHIYKISKLRGQDIITVGGEQPNIVFETLSELRTVSGRMQLAAKRLNGASVFVDYAHTPDAVKTALKAMRPHVMGRLLIIIGAGGDRDKVKRELIGKAAKKYADVVFVTDDNPRSEDPSLIGKGHETGQIIGDDILAFNDVEQASISVSTLDELLT